MYARDRDRVRKRGRSSDHLSPLVHRPCPAPRHSCLFLSYPVSFIKHSWFQAHRVSSSLSSSSLVHLRQLSYHLLGVLPRRVFLRAVKLESRFVSSVQVRCIIVFFFMITLVSKVTYALVPPKIRDINKQVSSS